MLYFAIKYMILVFKKLYWWIVLSRLRMNRKYLKFRILENEEEYPCHHQCTRHFIFGTRFFR